tara:strand:+ start:229 stop:678 length:450 start_codon:yes stop_codon:yes gene_type:complete
MNTLTEFHPKQWNIDYLDLKYTNLTITQYVKSLFKKFEFDKAILYIALYNLNKLVCNYTKIDSRDSHCILAICIFIAAKYYEDEYPGLEYFSLFSGIEPKNIENLEYTILTLLRFDTRCGKEFNLTTNEDIGLHIQQYFFKCIDFKETN